MKASRTRLSCIMAMTFLICILVHVQPAEASGFLQWTRSYNGYVNVSSSASDISVVVGPSPTVATDGTYRVSILNSTTGITVINATIDGQREPIVIRPQVTQAGTYTCAKLGDEAFDNTSAYYWCAVLLVSARFNIPPLILFPTGVVRPLLQTAAPWTCTETLRCLVRNTEQQTKSIGGCYRRSDPWPLLSSELAPQSTHVILVDSNGDVFSFRPLDVALGSGIIRKVVSPVPIWKSASIGWDSSFQYLALTYSTRVTGGTGQEVLRQDAVCALAIVGSDGSVALFDADRDNSSTTTGLPFIGMLDNDFNQNITNTSTGQVTTKYCYPYVQAVRRMDPGPNALFPSPLIRTVYGTVLAVNCKDGRGWFWDMQTATIVSTELHEPVAFSWQAVGNFQTPSAFDQTIASMAVLDPLGMDIEITLVQPTLALASTFYGPNPTVLPGNFLQYVTSVAAIRYLPNVYSANSNDGSDNYPTIALMTFVSAMGQTNSKITPSLTATLAGSAAVRGMYIQVDSTLYSHHNVTHSIGWVAAAEVPAQFNGTIPLSNNYTVPSELEAEVVASVSLWFAKFGMAYSVISDSVHVMLNGTTGLPIEASGLRIGNGTALVGGVKQAGMVRLDPYTDAMALSPILDWQDDVTNVNRSVFHNRATILTPSAMSPDQPTCVYSLAANAMGITFNILVTITDNVSTIVSGAWIPVPANEALFNPYTQNFCMATTVASESVALEMVPAGRSVFIVQVSADIMGQTSSRLTVNPLRDVIALTAQVSFSLDRNASNETALLHPQTLHPMGTPMIYVCGQRRLFAYYNVIGNTSWVYDFSVLSGCERCVCNQGDESLLLSIDRQYVVLIVNSELGEDVAEAIVILNAFDGSLLSFIDADTIASRSTECSSDVAPQFGQMQEISLSAAGIIGYNFVAIAAMLSTRCFIYVTVNHVQGKFEGDVYVFFFLGSSPILTSSIQIMQSTAYLNTEASKPNWWAGHYVYGIDVSACARTMQANSPSNPIGALPIFAADNVISSVAYGSMLFAVQVDITSGDYVILVMNTYIPSESSFASWTATLNHFPPAKYPQMQNVSVFILRNIFVCVASGPLQCYGASPTGSSDTPFYLDGTTVQHFGTPALDQWGAMIFATPPYEPHAISFSAFEIFPVYAWIGLTWPGSDEGVEMNVDQATCTDPQITNQGLVMVCGLQFDPLGTQNQRHMVFVESTTGQLLLADGPWAKPNTVIVSDSGIQIVYVNNLATAVSIQFEAFQQLVPLHFTGSLCRQQYDAVYSLSVENGLMIAQRTPTNASDPITTLNYVKQTYAYEWIGYMGLRLGRTYVIQSQDVISTLAPALPPVVVAENSMHLFVGNTLSIMNSDFNIALMDSSMCDVCVSVGCPTACTVELATGNQFMYQFSSESYTTIPKLNFSSVFPSGQGSPTYESFSGSVSLDMARTLSNLANQFILPQEQIPCYNASANVSVAISTTQYAPDGQYCLLDPRLSFKRWVIVQIASGLYSSTTMFSAPWNAIGAFTATQAPSLNPPWYIGDEVAILTLLNKGLTSGAFPDDFSTGSTQMEIVSATSGQDGNESTLTLQTADGQEITLSNATCVDMEQDIPFCYDEIVYFTDDMADTTMNTVTWVGSDDSNWGEGFITAGYSAQLSSIMRTMTKGAAVTCGELNTACPVSCQPTISCGAQINSYLGQILYVASSLPLQSTLPFPWVPLYACSKTDTISFAGKKKELDQKQLGAPSTTSTPGDLTVRIYCLKNGQVAIVADESYYLSTGNVIAAMIPQNEVFVGASFSCVGCTYFLLKGIVAEPFGWLGVGAVKNLIVCIMFYWLMEKVKERQRELNENRRKFKRHEKQIRLIDQRLRDIAMFERRLDRKTRGKKRPSPNGNGGGGGSGNLHLDITSPNPFDMNTSYVMLGGTQISQLALSTNAESQQNTVLFRNTMGDTQYTINDTRYSLGHETLHSSLLSEQANKDEPLFSPLLRLPRTFNKDVSKISEEEREVEKFELKRELERSRTAANANREERETIQQGRWWCSRALPNPIALYAKMVAAMGRFRRLEDRRLQVNKIKDNFVYKEFTPESLVEMLMAILGESSENRPQVVSFAHFYQWNLCDNRQWVVREHVDEQSQFASPEVLDGLENELLQVQQQLQDVYVMYKMAFEGNLTVDATQPFVIADYPLSKSESPLLSTADQETTTNQSSSKPQSQHNSDDSSEDGDNETEEDKKPLKSKPRDSSGSREKARKQKVSPKVGSPSGNNKLGANDDDYSSSDAEAPKPPTKPTTKIKQKVKSIRQQRRQRLELVEEQFRLAAHRQYAENVKDLARVSKQYMSTSLGGPSAKRIVQLAVADNLTKNVYFQGMDAYAQPLHRKANNNGPSNGFFAAGGSTSYVRLDGSSALVEHSRPQIDEKTFDRLPNPGASETLSPYAGRGHLQPPRPSSGAFRDALTDVENRSARANSTGSSQPQSTRTLGTESQYISETEDESNVNEPADVELTKALAQHELFRLLEVFNHCHDMKPHCFEYASLPSRKIDDKLLPSPLLIMFSLLETIITLAIYSWDVFARTYDGRDGNVRAFDVYQCVFFMVFNSSLPSSLIVNVIARADLGKTTHTKNALEKVKDIITNPYVVISALILATPIVTHVIPGFVAYIWLLGPALAISCGLEYYLRTRITVHSHSVIVARLFVRVVVLFTVAVVMSLSFNYSTSFLWGGQGYLATGAYVKGSYWNVIVNDFNSRSFACTWENILFAVSNFVQMGFLIV